jgi:hypothetical protein
MLTITVYTEASLEKVTVIGSATIKQERPLRGLMDK